MDETTKTEAFDDLVEVRRDDVELNRDSQTLDRYITLPSIVNFGLIVLVSWEAFAVTFQFALLNGGPASLLYGCILVGFGATFVSLSLAELASIDPAVGAQYRWSAHLAPAAPKFWGLIQGWLTVTAWVTAAASGPAFLSNVIIGLAIFNFEDYVPQRWHTTLISLGLIMVPFILNLVARRVLNAFELIGGLCHFVFFIIAVVTLAVLGQRSTPQFVFQTLTTGISGWENPGVSWGLGLLTVTNAVNAFDGTLHMSDEVKKVKTRVPHSIIIATLINSVMLFGFAICLLFTIGDLDAVENTPTGIPLIVVYYEATGSKTATTFLVLMPFIVQLFTQFNIYASVSRLIWTFAKDKGLPFSRQLSYVHPTLRLPVNALALVCGVSALISFIYIGSSTAFNAIVSLQAMALCISYMPPITFLALRRALGTAPQPGPFTMGRAGLPINILAVLYLIFVVTWMPFPQELPVTGSNMNYAGPIFGAVILAALLDWTISGHKRFKVPIAPKA